MRFSSKPAKVAKAANGPGIPPEFRVLRRIADSLRPLAVANLVTGLQSFQDRVDLKAVTEAIDRGDFEEVDRLVPYNLLEEDLAELRVIHERGIITGGEEASKFFKRSVAQLIPTVDAGAYTFSPDSPRIANIINNRTGLLIQGVQESTRQTVRGVVEHALREGLPPRRSARLIRGSIGLTPQQGMAVANFERKMFDAQFGKMTTFQRNSLSKTLRLGRPLRSTDLEDLSDAQLRRAVDQYSDRQLHLRAENIARTETFDAVNAGQLEVWDQAADDGLYNPKTSQKEWVVTQDERLCPICRPMNGVRVGMKDQFHIPGNDRLVDAPPAHPRCRCHIAIVFGEEAA